MGKTVAFFSLTLALVCGQGQVAASQLEIAPMSVEVPPAHTSAILYVTNRGSNESTIQLRAYRWHQDAGEDNLDLSEDLTLSPPIFTLAPGAQQVVRVVLKKTAAGSPPTLSTDGPESTYRIILDELPGVAEENSVRVAWRVSLPVFVETTLAAAPDLHWSVTRNTDGTISVSATNQGKRRTRVVNVSAAFPNGKELQPTHKVLGYILAGSRVSWSFEAPSGADQTSLVLRGLTESGPVNVPLSLPAAH